MTRLSENTMESAAVGGPVDFGLLAPTDHVPGEPLPLVLHLHGAMSSSASLAAARPLYDELTARGDLPRSLVVCASTPTLGGFYIDRPGAGWKSVVARELPAHIASAYGSPTAIAVLGASMGGYGALTIALGEPERFAAVAALSPAVFPGETPASVPAENLPSVLGELHAAMSAQTGDSEAYGANSVYGHARANANRIRQSGLAILVDCGGEDEFRLHEGAEFLHEVLDELDIAHNYRLVEGAGHLDPSAVGRTREAIRFIGAALTRTEVENHVR